MTRRVPHTSQTTAILKLLKRVACSLAAITTNGYPRISDLSLHQVRQTPDPQPVFAILEVPFIDLFRT